MRIGVLAVQGAFAEHEDMLLRAAGEENITDIEVFEIRQKRDLEQDFDGLIFPGGESTVMGKLIKDLDMFNILKERIENGIPVLGTCAGLILLAEKLSNDGNVYFGTLPVTVKRNAYGRQLGSFRTTSDVKDVGEITMEFIRAPYIESVGEGVEVIAEVDGNIVGVRYKNQIGISFHPEVTKDTAIHRYFLKKCK